MQNILLSWGIINFHKKRRERTRLRGYLGATVAGCQTAWLFEEARYIIRYFQPDGKGRLKMDDGTVFKPNDRYPLTKDVFRLYYTSASTDQQTIDMYVEDNFGQTTKLSFEFNSQRDEEKEKKDEDRK